MCTRGSLPTRVALRVTLIFLQVGFFPSECVELFTERPGPGLKAGKYHGEWAAVSLTLGLPLVLSTIVYPQMLTVPCVASQLPRVFLL